MPLDKTTAYFPFSKGVDTKSDPKSVVPGKLLKLENGYFQTPGMIRKRPGYVALPQQIANGGGSLSGGVSLATFRSELTAADGSNLYSYSQAVGSWVPKGTYSPCQVTSQAVYHDQYQEWAPTSAYSASAKLYCYAWERQGSTNSVLYSVYDAVTGQAVVSATVADAAGICPKVFLVGSNFLVVWYRAGSLYYLQIPTANPFPGTYSPVAITSDVATNAFGWEGAVFNGRLYLAYNLTSGVGLRYITAGLSVSAETVRSGIQMSNGGSVSTDASNNVYVAAYNGTSLQGFVYDSTLTTVVLGVVNLSSAATITRVGSVNTGTLTYTYYEVTQTNSYDSYIQYAVWSSAAVLSQNNTLVRSVGMSSKPFIYGGTVYLLANYYSALQPTYFLLSVNTGIATVTAKIGSGSGASSSRTQLAEAQQVSTGVYQFAVQEVDQVEALGPANYQTQSTGYKWGVSSAVVSFVSPAPAIEIGSNLHIPGGVLLAYDGTNLVEQNFHVYPEQSPAPVINTSGGNIGAGQYQYCAIYEWVDGQGQLHRSAPSTPLTLTTTGTTNQVTLRIPTLRVTAKSGVLIGLYRTASNGTIFYRVNNVGTYIYNDPTVDYVTYVDGLADTTLQGNNQLYTTGGEVDNSSPPAVTAMVNFKNRLFALASETPYQLWYSKQVIPGQPVEFSAFFTQNIDPNGGPITALAQMDDKLIIFKSGAIFAMVGNGPAISGSGNDYGDAQFISGDCGTVSQASVVVTPDGIMFQGAKGICLLSRELGTPYVGKDVEAYVQAATVTSAVLYASFNHVRFTLSSGVCLVYDYLVGEWSVFTDIAAASACNFQGSYTFLTAQGLVLQESASVFKDNGAFYALKVQTSWLSFAGMQGYQRVREVEVLGDWKSAHNLQVQVGYDFEAVPSQTSVLHATTAVTPYQYRVHLQRQTCQSVQVTLQDTQTAPYGEGLDLSGLAFEVGVKRGLRRINANQSYG